ncbi:MAG: ATP-binding protein [Hyphomicrobiaceae bacterium]
MAFLRDYTTRYTPPRLKSQLNRARALLGHGKNWFLRTIAEMLPKGLYARALIIIIAPIVVLEGVVAFVFMERHWQSVTRRLSEATARNIGAIVAIYEDYPYDDGHRKLIDLAKAKLDLDLHILPPEDLPATQPKPFFDLLDRALSREIGVRVKRPFWISVNDKRFVEIRVRAEDGVLRFIARRSQTYASNSHIFLLWMAGSSIILLTVAIMFLRNQIRPILRLSKAADAFGKGRPVPEDFRPRGAREVRQAAETFLEMRERITTHVEQRTTMLAGVSHDLRTVLTRFKLELALLGDSPGTESLTANVNEMQHMLEDYLAFSKGDDGEQAQPTNLYEFLEEINADADVYDADVELKLSKRRKKMLVPLKRRAFKRAITNLVSNAARYGDHVVIRVNSTSQVLQIHIDDDGPGIPEHQRTQVFRPFYRIDSSRNQDVGNTGLGLAIARDIVRSHGGDILLGESELGGLRATISVPL